MMSLRVAVAACMMLALCACASAPVASPPNLHVGTSPATLPSPRARANDAAPQIQAIALSSLDVRRGQRWSGRIVTSTNVASVEIRTNLFSLDVPRTDFGRFAFTLNVFDLPPIFIRPYWLRVIARNAAGEAVEEDMPFRLR
ncbi:MAG: hypothetical protein ACXVAM_04315 [Vulcanimicrobiaceae bacterium]